MEPTVQKPLSAEQQAHYEAACARLDPERLKRLLFDITNIHSPTGATREVCEYLAGHMENVGLRSRYHPMSEISGNVLGEKRGSGGGATRCSTRPSTRTSKAMPRISPGLAPSSTRISSPRRSRSVTGFTAWAPRTRRRWWRR